MDVGIYTVEPRFSEDKIIFLQRKNFKVYGVLVVGDSERRVEKEGVVPVVRTIGGLYFERFTVSRRSDSMVRDPLARDEVTACSTVEEDSDRDGVQGTRQGEEFRGIGGQIYFYRRGERVLVDLLSGRPIPFSGRDCGYWEWKFKGWW